MFKTFRDRASKQKAFLNYNTKEHHSNTHALVTHFFKERTHSLNKIQNQKTIKI